MFEGLQRQLTGKPECDADVSDMVESWLGQFSGDHHTAYSLLVLVAPLASVVEELLCDRLGVVLDHL